MKNKSSIAILLATYNSADYLEAQLDSLLNQTVEDWTLFISDDGSEDRTIGIIDKYVNTYPGKIFRLNLNSKNMGASLNFQSLWEHIDSAYYMFCDHDDYWLPYKIKHTLYKMKIMEEQYPDQGIVVHTDLVVVDEHLRVIHPSFYSYLRTDPVKFGTFNYLGVANCVTGCTMMLNAAVKQIVPPIPDRSIWHDWWLALNVAKKGKIAYLAEQTILYRQHKNNVVGARKVGIKYLLDILLHLKKTLALDVNNYKYFKTVGYGSPFKYMFYKLYFQIRRYRIRN